MYKRKMCRWALTTFFWEIVIFLLKKNTASVGGNRDMWWCCNCTWPHQCELLTFRNTCHDSDVTAVTRGQACAGSLCSCQRAAEKHQAYEHAAGETHQISWLPAAFYILCLQSWWEHCHWHSDPGLWAKPGVKMGSWGYPRGPWQTSGLLPQPHLNMNEIGICRNFMNVDTENQSVFHWICLRLPASGVAGAARNEWVQPSLPNNLNKIAHLYLSIFTSVVYLVFFHCVFATISIAKTS